MATRNCFVSIIGDSISTFKGYLPANQHYYPSPDLVPDVLGVEDTWWYQLITARSMKLLINDSYSGSTICTAPRKDFPAETAFIRRMKHSLSADGINGKKPACIIIFGGTNDNWNAVEIGQPMYENRSDADLEKMLPAYCYMLDYITMQNPSATVLSIIHTNFKPEVHKGMLDIGKHYGIINVELKNIEKKHGAHPSGRGMRQIADQINHALG